MITGEALQKIDTHWAVLAVGDEKLRRSILRFSKAKLVENAIGERLAMAYEMAAIEGMHDFINHTDNNEMRDQFLAGSHRAFEIYSAFEIPINDDLKFVFHLLHLSALACCGDCWTDLKRIYDDCSGKIDSLSPDQTTDWDQRILFRLFDCWVSLFRKDSWSELTNIATAISKLRDEQARYEGDYLKADLSNENARAMGLLSLYHLARATELLSLYGIAAYALQGEPVDIKFLIREQFIIATKLATAGGDAQLEILLRWLRSSAERMTNGSIWWVDRAKPKRSTEAILDAK